MTDHFSDTPTDALSREIADAAGDLAFRINLGDFDDLDEAQMADLRMLSDMMAQWAQAARALEKSLAIKPGTISLDLHAPAFRVNN